MMDKELRAYLEWRFRVNNHAKYQKYRDEWINNLNETQCYYFKKEMAHLIERGVYH